MSLEKSFVNQSMRKPRLTMGVSATAIGTIVLITILSAELVAASLSWAYAPIPGAIGLLWYLILRWVYKEDHCAFQIYTKYAAMADEYHPDSASNLPMPFGRPIGAGKGFRI